MTERMRLLATAASDIGRATVKLVEGNNRLALSCVTLAIATLQLVLHDLAKELGIALDERSPNA